MDYYIFEDDKKVFNCDMSIRYSIDERIELYMHNIWFSFNIKSFWELRKNIHSAMFYAKLFNHNDYPLVSIFDTNGLLNVLQVKNFVIIQKNAFAYSFSANTIESVYWWLGEFFDKVHDYLIENDKSIMDYLEVN